MVRRRIKKTHKGVRSVRLPFDRFVEVLAPSIEHWTNLGFVSPETVRVIVGARSLRVVARALKPGTREKYEVRFSVPKEA